MKVRLGEADKDIITIYEVHEGDPADNTIFCQRIKGHRQIFNKKLESGHG